MVFTATVSAIFSNICEAISIPGHDDVLAGDLYALH